MIMGPNDDTLVAGEYPAEMMGFNFGKAFRRVARLHPLAIAARQGRRVIVRRRRRMHGDDYGADYYGDPDYYGSWLSEGLKKVKAAVKGGTLAVGPGGVSLTKPLDTGTPGALPGGGTGGGIMDFVKSNPLIVGGAAVVLVILMTRK